MIALKTLGSLVLCLILCLLQIYCYAQDKPNTSFGKLTSADFSVPASSLIDSNTNAIMLSDIGSVSFIGNKQAWYSYVYKRQTRIKILNKKAFDLATVSVSLY